MIYRVIIKVSYNESFFEFITPDEACLFARIALEHSVASEDQKKMAKISIVVINPKESEED